MTGRGARRVDAHQHFWRLDRADYGWLTPAQAPIYRDFEPADLAPLLARAGIDATVLVQAAPTVAETRFLLELAAATPAVAGVVGWAPLAAPNAPDVVAELARAPHLKGLRPMIHDIPDVDWMLGPALAPGLRAIAASDLVFDALVRPPHLPNLRRLLDRHPDLRVVIDHGAKPEIGEGRARALGHPHGRPRPGQPRVGEALGTGDGGRRRAGRSSVCGPTSTTCSSASALTA